MEEGKGNDGIGDINACQDRISELPEPIIHHIFSFLHCSKDVVRTSILSKRWKSVFDSYHIYDFDERQFREKPGHGKHNRIKAREIQRKKFYSYVEKTFALKLDPVPCIDKFRLYVKTNTNMMILAMQRWIRTAVKKNVKELDVHFRISDNMFVFPSDVLLSNSLTSLKLAGIIIFGFSDVKIPNLKLLSVKDAILINDYTMKKFEEGCPLIEDLRLVFCEGLLHLNISNLSKLRRMEVHSCSELEYFGIDAATLETFLYSARKDHGVCTLDLKILGNLKNLTLKDCKMKEDAFHDIISKCPLLENLVLLECNHLKFLTILSWKLKSLALLRCEKLCLIDVHAPNLFSFQYSGFKRQFHWLMKCVGLCEAKFFFDRVSTIHWVPLGYQGLMGNFYKCRGFKLMEHSNQRIKIYEEPRDARLIPRSVFKLVLTKSYTGIVKVVDGWLQESHVRSLLAVAPSNELTKLLESLLIDREDSPNKCWQHDIADVKYLALTSLQRMYYEFKWRPKQKSH